MYMFAHTLELTKTEKTGWVGDHIYTYDIILYSVALYICFFYVLAELFVLIN